MKVLLGTKCELLGTTCEPERSCQPKAKRVFKLSVIEQSGLLYLNLEYLSNLSDVVHETMLFSAIDKQQTETYKIFDFLLTNIYVVKLAKCLHAPFFAGHL